MVRPVSPELSLAFGVASNPGVYALLLGSGVSRSAEIPTGWEVVLDLIRKLAVVEGADPEPDPADWYSATYGESPQYSALLERLAPQPAERQSLLRGYFEASDEERAEGIKGPTAAHRAIADLVASGLIRVIVTTNFDRLIESALESVGITPLVIATADQAVGAPPLAHNQCTIIKVHGDYLDPRIRNSDAELATYEPAFDSLLDQVIDEYGLIVCGWSGDYDGALRAALERSKSRRYTTYWCAHGTVSDAAEALITHRAAQVILIADADSFFRQLAERVTALREVGTRHPLETHAAVETLKRYLPDERHRIRLSELIRDTTEELVSRLHTDDFPTDTDYSDEELTTRTKRLEALSETSLALTANGSFWGESKHDDSWLGTVRRLAEADVPQNGKIAWLGLFRYPALLHLYGAGIAAVAAHKYDLLATLLQRPVRSVYGPEDPIVRVLYPHEVIEAKQAHILFPHPGAPRQKYPAPLSHHLESVIRPTFVDLIPSDQDYADAFDRFECLACLVHQDLFEFRIDGLFVSRGRVWQTIRSEIEESPDDWPPLRAGLFGGSIERLESAKSEVDRAIARARWP